MYRLSYKLVILGKKFLEILMLEFAVYITILRQKVQKCEM